MSDAVPGQGQATNEECLAALQEYQTQKRVCDSEGGVLRSIVKRWKAAGVPIPAMLATARASKRDPEEVVAEIRETLRLMQLRKIPVSRFNLFPETVDMHVAEKAQAEDDMWGVEDRGYRAGLSGVSIDDNPFPFGTDRHVAWVKFWHQGQAVHARVLGDNARRITANRRRPAGHKAEDPATEEGNEGDTSMPLPFTAERVEADLGRRAVTRKARGKNGAAPTPRRRRRSTGDQPEAA